MSLLTGNVLEEVDSPINGKIRVVRSLGLGTYIQVENITQSGGIVRGIWRATLKQVAKLRPQVKNCLILGLGGGTAAGQIIKNWPNAKITGVDSDAKMVEMGQKYLGLKEVECVIGDGLEYCLKAYKKGQKYDLILIDIYLGRTFPSQFEKEDFLVWIKGLLESGGIAVFNRLYYGEKRPEAMKFASKLEKTFPSVEYYYPQANLMYLCSS